MRAIWDRGVARGELRPDLDPDAALDQLIGPMLYRLLMGHAPLDETSADALVDGAHSRLRTCVTQPTVPPVDRCRAARAFYLVKLNVQFRN